MRNKQIPTRQFLEVTKFSFNTDFILRPVYYEYKQEKKNLIKKREAKLNECGARGKFNRIVNDNIHEKLFSYYYFL
jgi:hypothetical protein